MHIARTLAAVAFTLVACHDDAKPSAVPLPESSASSLGSVSAATPPLVAPAEIVIETGRITVRGQKVLDLPADRSAGADPKDKRSGKNDLYLVPLADAYAMDAGHAGTITIDVDDSTPYRMLLEVLFTLGQRELTHWELRRRGRAETLPIDPPRAVPNPFGPPPPGLNLVVLLVDGGISIKATGGNMATGCDAVAAGLAVPKRDGRNDYPALAACLHKLKAQSPSERKCTFTALASVEFTEVWAAIDVIRGEKRDLFPDVQLGLSH